MAGEGVQRRADASYARRMRANAIYCGIPRNPGVERGVSEQQQMTAPQRENSTREDNVKMYVSRINPYPTNVENRVSS